MRVRGRYDYNNEVFVGPLAPPKGDLAARMSRRHEPRGFYVYTPLVIVRDGESEREGQGGNGWYGVFGGGRDNDDARTGDGAEGRQNEEKILVNRGWIPRSVAEVRKAVSISPHGRSSSREGENESGDVVEVSGIIDRGPLKKPPFVPETSEEQAVSLREYFWLDLPRIQRDTGVLERGNMEKGSFLVATRATGRRMKDVGGGSEDAGRQTSRGDGDSGAIEGAPGSQSLALTSWPAVKSREDFLEFYVSPFKHKIYAGTWFSLAAFGTLMTFLRFKK